MKKIIAALCVCLVTGFMFSCQTPPPNEEDMRESQADAALKQVYKDYSGKLILDGAAKYTVKPDDTLAHIGRALYGSGYYYPLIVLASQDVIKDFDEIKPGQVLTVPDLNKNLGDSTARGILKSFLKEVSVIEKDRGRIGTGEGMEELSDSL